MIKTKLNIGVLWVDSIRSLAYLDAFDLLGLYPSEIIQLTGKIPNFESLISEDRKYNYSYNFFNIKRNLFKNWDLNETKKYTLDTSDINDPKVICALRKCTSKYFIYTGGGLLNVETLNQGKLFIHVHPGILPKYKGSTCFYYSILDDFTLGSTAFILQKEIDTGKVIVQTKFKINYKILNEQLHFMDNILDPYIRAVTLKKVLVMIKKGKVYSTVQKKNDLPAYYVMHPLLRHLAVKKINNHFNSHIPAGITAI